MSKIKRFNKGWTSVPNNLLNDDNLSFKAKGLYAFLNSKPEDWDFSVDRIAEQSKDGRDAVRSALKELESVGWVKRTPAKSENGTFIGYDYWIYDTPTTEEPSTGFPWTVCPMTENPVTISNKEGVKKEVVKKRKEETAPDFQNFRIRESREKIINLLQGLSPKLMSYPGISQIVDAIEEKPEGKQEAYIRFVISNKKPEKIFDLKGWREWFWNDFWVNEQKPEQEKKVTVFDEKELAMWKSLDINPYGAGTWEDQFKTDKQANL